MRSEERWYYLDRARTSLELAQQAQDSEIAAIHMDIYKRYMERAATSSIPSRELHLVRQTSAR